MQASSTRAAVSVVIALLCACAPPPPEEPEDLLPCTALRRQICGANDECVNPPDPDDCMTCKRDLCTRVREFEADNQQGLCLLEFRARPQYPICKAPDPLPTIPPPPFIVSVLCERQCSPIPYPPLPPLPSRN